MFLDLSDPHPDPLVRSTDPDPHPDSYQNSWIPNTAKLPDPDPIYDGSDWQRYLRRATLASRSRLVLTSSPVAAPQSYKYTAQYRVKESFVFKAVWPILSATGL
jgi:hypothetical protein